MTSLSGILSQREKQLKAGPQLSSHKSLRCYLVLWTMNPSPQETQKHLDFMYPYCALFRIAAASDSFPELFV